MLVKLICKYLCSAFQSFLHQQIWNIQYLCVINKVKNLVTLKNVLTAVSTVYTPHLTRGNLMKGIITIKMVVT